MKRQARKAMSCLTIENAANIATAPERLPDINATSAVARAIVLSLMATGRSLARTALHVGRQPRGARCFRCYSFNGNCGGLIVSVGA